MFALAVERVWVLAPVAVECLLLGVVALVAHQVAPPKVAELVRPFL